MATATTSPDKTAFLLRRWQEILDDPAFKDYHQRVETDEFGNTIMSPRPTGKHDKTCQSICQVLNSLPGDGGFLEHEVLTDKGMKIADVLWVSPTHPWNRESADPIIPAPDICVEVRSPRNTVEVLIEKRDAYLRAGAKEVWICDDNRLYFFDSAEQIPASKLCPWCPDNVVDIRRRLERPVQAAIRRALRGLLQPFTKEPRAPVPRSGFSAWPSPTHRTPDEPSAPGR